MNPEGRLKVVIVVCILLSFSFLLAQNEPQAFSADYVFTDSGSKEPPGRIYFSWPYLRMDNAKGIVLIANYTTRIQYSIFTEKHNYFESVGPEYTFDHMNPCAKRADITCKAAGKSTVNGRACDLWETTDKSGRPGSVCIDQKLRFPVRVKNGNGTTVEYINIKAEPQPASLFEIPAGYTKVDNPFARPGNDHPQPTPASK